MRAAVRWFAPLLLVFALFPSAAMADSLDAARPSSFFQFDAEVSVQLFGSNLLGTAGTRVTFSGPAGTFSTEPQTGSPDSLDVAVPDQVLLVAGSYDVTVLAQDDAATRTIGPITIKVVPRPITEPPLLQLPEAVRAEAINSDGGTAQFTVGARSFDGTPLTPSCDRNSGDSFPIGTSTVTCSATDQFGTTTGTFLVVVSDSTVPVITVPNGITTDAHVVEYNASAVDNIDGAIAVHCSPASGSTFPFGTTTVVCTADDRSLNRAIASFDITVTGGTPPSLILPQDFSIEATGSTGVIVNYSVFTDAGATVDCTPPSGLLFPVGKIAVQCEATSANGSTRGAFFVTVTDTTPPTLSLPADIQIDSNQPTAVTYGATAVDLVDGSEVVTCTPPSGSTFARGTTTVTCEATDLHGNKATGTFKVIVGKAEPPPTLNLPADITAEATSAAGAAVTYSVSSNGTVSCSPASSATFALGATTVQCTATGPGGTTSGSFKVTVVDTTPPAITVPGTITAEATSASGAVVTYTASAFDKVDGTVAASCAPPAGSTFPIGTTAVQCTATDAHGNSSSSSFTVIVQDTTSPVISKIEANPSLLWPPDHTMRLVTLTVTATDAVSAPVSRIISITANQPANGVGDGNTVGDWQITGPLTVQLRAERSQGNDRIYTITVETVDAAGNRSVGTVTVTVTNSKPRAVR